MNKLLKTLAAATTLAIASSAIAAPVGVSLAPAPFNVTITLTPICSITTPPADVTFTYTSYQAGVANSAGGGFAVRCTTNLGYTMALDSTTGTVGGLPYTIGITGGNSGTGAGVTPNSHTIAGTIAANLSGDVTASMTSARTLTISY
jgi:hypothetical protein